MSFHKLRIARLEARQRQAQATAHHRAVLFIPHGVSPWEQAAYLAQQPCACEQVGCHLSTIGAIVPQACSPTQWQECAAAYEDRRRLEGWQR